ncbi:MAG: hypothetical protein SGARI_003585, partial [Bacillariaceae sp.]
SFTATAEKNKEDVQSWLKLLAKEIVERVAQDAARNHRYPKTCTLNYAFYTTPDGKRLNGYRRGRQTKSLRLTFPPERVPLSSQSDSLLEQSMAKMSPIMKDCLISGVGLAAANFESRGQPPEGNASIESFFKAAPKVDDDNIARASNAASEGSTTTPAVVKKKEKKISDRTSNKRSRTGFNSFFSRALPLESENVEDVVASLDENSIGVAEDDGSTLPPVLPKQEEEETVDADLELAKKLQASFDRENYVFSKVSQRKVIGSVQKKAAAPKKPKTKTLDAFFSER